MKQTLKTQWKTVCLFCFSATQTFAWGVAMFASGEWTRYVGYFSVVICFFFTLFCAERRRGSYFQIGAFFFTCIADYFLVLLGGAQKTLAMCAFLCAQILYACRTLEFAKTDKEKRLNVLLRVALAALGAAVTFLVLGAQTRALYVISVVYYLQLVSSIVFSFVHFKESAEAKLSAIGFLSFSLCDITIGLDFLVDIFSLTQSGLIYRLSRLPISPVHIFYPPSQALLAVSAYVKEK